jgi:hypothetical protein
MDQRTLIVSITLVNPQYRDEIFGLIGQAGQAILHVFLDVPAGELHRRIDAQRIREADAGRDAGARAFSAPGCRTGAGVRPPGRRSGRRAPAPAG